MGSDLIKFYGAAWCVDCKRVKKLLGQHHVRYEYLDVDDDSAALSVVKEVNQGEAILPTILFPDGSVLAEPSNAELAAKLGLQSHPKSPYYDLLVVGAGPAGLTTAMFAGREGIDTLVIDRGVLGGQPGNTEKPVENFPGFPEPIPGVGLAERLVAHCRRYGVELMPATEAVDIGEDGNDRYLKLANGDEVRARAMLLAVGSVHRRLGVPGEEDFIGAGVHYCATCDGPLYRDKDVLVVGAGNSAVEESLNLTRVVRHVTILVRGQELTASLVAREKALHHPQIDVLYETTIAEIRGDGEISSVILRNLGSGATLEAHPGAVFVFIGSLPGTDWLKGRIALDDNGFILTDATLQTNVPGIFAAGDARTGSTKQLASAAGEGATAGVMIRRYLEKTKVIATRKMD